MPVDLIELTKSGNLKAVREFLASLHDSSTHIDEIHKLLNLEDDDGNTALHHAVLKGYVRIVLSLLAEGADINHQNKQGNTPAHLATQSNLDGMLLWLVRKGAELKHIRNLEGKAPIAYASPTSKRLVKDYQNSLLYIPSSPSSLVVSNPIKERFHELAKQGDIAGLKDMLSKYTNERKRLELIESRSLEGKNALHFACEHNIPKQAEFLLQLGADPDREEEYMNTPLIIASARCQGDPEIVRLLVHYGATVNAKSMFGNVPLILAAENGFKQVVELLIEYGKADVNAIDNEGNTALHYAAAKRYDAIALYLKENGANLNITNKSGSTPLELASHPLRCLLTGVELSEDPASGPLLLETSQIDSQLDYDKLLGKLVGYQIPYQDLEFSERIGEGNFGEVFKAKWNDREVAVKRVGNTWYTKHKALVLLAEEISILAELSHPNIVAFVGASTSQSELCVITEWLSRGNLSHLLLKAQFRFQLPMVMRIARGIVAGVEFIHSKGYIHRDLRAANILIDEDWNAKICDFGLACRQVPAQEDIEYGREVKPTPSDAQENQTPDKKEVNSAPALSSSDRNTAVSGIGPLRWMAPEVFRKEVFSSKADIYSLGMLLWEIVANEIPFSDQPPLPVAVAASEEDRRPMIPASIANSPLAAIIKKCWDPSPLHRPSATEVGELLHAGSLP